MIWIAIGVGVLVLAGGLFWWLRRRRRMRLISFVALLREPAIIEPGVLARIAGKAWNADLGNGEGEGEGESQGADGFVVGVNGMITIMHDQRMFLVIGMNRTYTENPKEVADAIPDLRIRSLFLEHTAWFSCDAMGVDGSTSEAEVREFYQRLGRLFAELLDDNCLLIFLPDSGMAYPINEDTELALRSVDPVAELQATVTVPIIEVADDDPLMIEAVGKARADWPRFVDAFEVHRGENFSVKAPVSHSGNTEFIWIAVTAIEGERIYGELGNDPADLGPLKLGSKVSVLLTDLNDWCYIDDKGNMVGGFTIEAIQKAAKRPRKKE